MLKAQGVLRLGHDNDTHKFFRALKAPDHVYKHKH